VKKKIKPFFVIISKKIYIVFCVEGGRKKPKRNRSVKITK